MEFGIEGIAATAAAHPMQPAEVFEVGVCGLGLRVKG